MKSRLVFLSISLFFAFLVFPLLKPQAQLNNTSNNPNNNKQIMTDWLKSRLKAQIANNNSEAWQRELPQSTPIINTKEKTLRVPNKILSKLSRSLQDYYLNQANQTFIEPMPSVVSGENFRINDPNQETGSRVQNNTSSAISGDNIIVAYNDIGTEISAISYSNDGGNSWKTSQIPQLAGGRNFGSGIVAASGNVFYYTGLAVNSQAVPLIIASRSTDAGQSWSNPIVVSKPANGSFQDKPWIAVDNSSSATRGNVYIGWTDFISVGLETGAQIVCATSTNAGVSFNEPITISSLDASFNVQGVTIAIGPEGQVNLAWGDGGVSGISFSRSIDGGKSFFPRVAAAIVERYQLLGILLNSHFDANGLPSLAVDTSNSPTKGTLYITFNAASLTNPKDRADVLLVRSTNQGSTWSMPVKLNDDNTITDQFMPSVAVATDGTLGVMWYDRRNDPLFNGMLEVYATTSNNGALSFAPNQRVSNANWGVLTTPSNIRNNYHGDYNQISAFTSQPGFFFNWGDDRSGKDADVFGVKQSLPFQVANNLIISPFNPSQTIVANQKTQFRLSVNTKTPFTVTASSDTDTISFEFENRKTQSGQEVLVRARTTNATPLGSHPVIVNLSTSDGLKTSSTLRLNVIATQNTPSLPLNVSKTINRSVFPSVALDRDNVVYSSWADESLGNLRIFFAKSTNNGNSFSLPIDISKSDNFSTSPQVAISPDKTINIVWQECPSAECFIMNSRSTDQGASFSKPVVVSEDIDFSELPSIVTNPNGEVVVFWDGARSLNEAKFEIFASKSSNNGEKFSFPFVVASDSGRNLFTTSASSDGKGNSYLAYESCRSGNCRVDIKKSNNGFNTFTDGAIASGDLNFAIKPTISSPGNGVIQVAMTVNTSSQTSRFEIFTSSSTNDTASFSTPKNVSKTLEVSNDAAILAIKQQVYIAWMDKNSGNPDILLVKSTDQGNNFSQPINITSNNTISQVPNLVVDSNDRVYLSYQDEMDGNDEVYYLRIDGSPLPSIIDSFSPTSGTSGTNISVKGQELAQTSSISIGGEQAKFFFASPNEIIVIVPNNARSGALSLSTTNGIVNTKDLFNVANPVINLLSPVGKEKLSSGMNFDIKWQVDGVEVDSFDLLLSTDSGVTFPINIASNLASTDRVFTWKVPALKTKTARIVLVTKSSSGVSFMTLSKANFKIKAK
ncbi:MAG: exo-alpha-sialidase [Acidobacteria bacterium]|nr:exo-alpha-sialidase [Acidobacteriota bacterium]